MKNFRVVAGGGTKNEGAEALLKELRVVKQLHANSMGAPPKVLFAFAYLIDAFITAHCCRHVDEHRYEDDADRHPTCCAHRAEYKGR